VEIKGGEKCGGKEKVTSGEINSIRELLHAEDK